jgi:anti-sigma-K factor RskA/putative zinc finger protein
VITHPDAWKLLPDVAAGTCPPDEHLALEAHLAHCSACRAELESLREAVSYLSGVPAPLDPPSSLRARVLAIPHTLPDEERTEPDPAPALLVRRDPRRRFGLGAVAATATVAAALAALVTGLAFRQSETSRFSAAQDLALRPTARAGSASGSFLIGHANGPNVPVELRVSHLAQPSHGGYYEVWLGRKSGARLSLGKVVVSRSGSATVQLNMPSNATREYEWVWVTRERDDGNPAPSHDTVLKQGLA